MIWYDANDFHQACDVKAFMANWPLTTGEWLSRNRCKSSSSVRPGSQAIILPRRRHNALTAEFLDPAPVPARPPRVTHRLRLVHRRGATPNTTVDMGWDDYRERLTTCPRTLIRGRREHTPDTSGAIEKQESSRLEAWLDRNSRGANKKNVMRHVATRSCGRGTRPRERAWKMGCGLVTSS